MFLSMTTAALALTCAPTDESCHAANAASGMVNTAAPNTIVDNATKARFRTSTVDARIEAIRSTAEASGCVVAGTVLTGASGGAYTQRGNTWDGTWQASGTPDSGSLSGQFGAGNADGFYTGTQTGTIGAQFGTYNRQHQFATNWDDGFFMGSWERTRGKNGIYYGVYGWCPGDVATAFDGWFIGGLDAYVNDATCDDMTTNGQESDVDCGGPDCPTCALGDTCNNDWDCDSGSCAMGICAPPETCAPLTRFPGHYDCVDLALAGNATASSVWGSFTPGMAFDGDTCTNWNAGTYGGWLNVDLGQPETIDGLTLKVAQAPNGTTTHHIEASNDGVTWTIVDTLTGFTSNGQEIYASFASPITARHVRVWTPSSVSWVAWFDVAVWQCP